MSPIDISPIKIARANEQLRQEREIFDQEKIQQNRWFLLRLVMGYAAVVLLLLIMIVSTVILYHHSTFNGAILTAAGSALFVDSLGLIISIWKVVFNPSTLASIRPQTQEELPE
jgi:hypothetical protein